MASSTNSHKLATLVRRYILNDYGRINYELKAYGQAVVMVPPGINELELADALAELRRRYSHVSMDCDNDIIIFPEEEN